MTPLPFFKTQFQRTCAKVTLAAYSIASMAFIIAITIGDFSSPVCRLFTGIGAAFAIVCVAALMPTIDPPEEEA